MGFREECDLCGRSMRVVNAKQAFNKQDGEITMCKACEDKQVELKAYYEKHTAKCNKKIERVILEAKKEAEKEFTRIMFERQDARIKAIESGGL